MRTPPALKRLLTTLLVSSTVVAAAATSLVTAPGAHALPDASTTDVQVAATPAFQTPLPCGERWTYSTYNGHNYKALDFVSAGGVTRRKPALAAAAGTVQTRAFEAGGAGNYIVINHGGGWTTHYMHLDEFSVSVGQTVNAGTQIGLIGTTGGSTGDHLHFEERLNGTAQNIVLDGRGLDYPYSYNQSFITSGNCGGTPPEPPAGKAFQTWGSGVNVRADATTASAVVGSLPSPTTIYVVCQKQGQSVTVDGYTSTWWSKLSSPVKDGFVSNVFVSDPNAKLPGVPDC